MCPIFQKVAQKSLQAKKGQNMYNKTQFENPKHLHQSTFETLKYPTTNHVLKLHKHVGENVII
jgi:hypothetical protein